MRTSWHYVRNEAVNYKTDSATGRKKSMAPPLPAHQRYARRGSSLEKLKRNVPHDSCGRVQMADIFRDIAREIMAMLVSDDRESIVAPS